MGGHGVTVGSGSIFTFTPNGDVVQIIPNQFTNDSFIGINISDDVWIGSDYSTQDHVFLAFDCPSNTLWLSYIIRGTNNRVEYIYSLSQDGSGGWGKARLGNCYDRQGNAYSYDQDRFFYDGSGSVYICPRDVAIRRSFPISSLSKDGLVSDEVFGAKFVSKNIYWDFDNAVPTSFSGGDKTIIRGGRLLWESTPYVAPLIVTNMEITVISEHSNSTNIYTFTRGFRLNAGVLNVDFIASKHRADYFEFLLGTASRWLEISVVSQPGWNSLRGVLLYGKPGGVDDYGIAL